MSLSKSNGIKILTSSELIKAETNGNLVSAIVKSKKEELVLKADVILSAVGIKSNINSYVKSL